MAYSEREREFAENVESDVRCIRDKRSVHSDVIRSDVTTNRPRITPDMCHVLSNKRMNLISNLQERPLYTVSAVWVSHMLFKAAASWIMQFIQIGGVSVKNEIGNENVAII